MFPNLRSQPFDSESFDFGNNGRSSTTNDPSLHSTFRHQSISDSGCENSCDMFCDDQDWFSYPVRDYEVPSTPQIISAFSNLDDFRPTLGGTSSTTATSGRPSFSESISCSSVGSESESPVSSPEQSQPEQGRVNETTRKSRSGSSRPRGRPKKSDQEGSLDEIARRKYARNYRKKQADEKNWKDVIIRHLYKAYLYKDYQIPQKVFADIKKIVHSQH